MAASTAARTSGRVTAPSHLRRRGPRSGPRLAVEAVHAIDDADYRRVRRRGRPADGGHRRPPFLHNQHAFTDPRLGGVHGQQRRAVLPAAGVDRLHEQQLRPEQLLVFLRRDDGTGHPGKLHARAQAVASGSTVQ